MLTTSTAQYLHPDYLQPLPTTLDAKKSPLALLAQTCSAIGKDTTPGKSIIPPLEKKGESKSVSPKSGDGRKSHPSSEKREKTPPSDKTSTTKDIPPLITTDRKSPLNAEGRSPKSSSSETTTSTSGGLSPSTGSNARISLNCGSLSLEVSHQEAAIGLSRASVATTTTTPSRQETLPAPAALPPTIGLHGCASVPGLLGHPHLAGLEASHLYQASLAAHHGKGHPGPHGSISPYVAYARVKTATGASTLVPVCRDPYCTNCQITMQNAQLSSPACGAGCTQCTHEKAPPSSVASSFHTPSSLPLLPLGASSLTAGALNPLASSLYSHSFSSLAGHHSLPPYVCNWVAGSDYCGKRFTTSEELLQHLRTHTSSSDSSAAALAAGLSPYTSLALAAPSLAACHGASHYGGSLSPNSLRQAYSRSLSPNTLLAASRYHPYKSPLAATLPTPPSAALPGLPAGLGAYYPYSLYGQRLGPAVTP